MSAAEKVDPWAHYMNCGALVTVELLADLLGCREDQVEHEVRRLMRRAGGAS